MTRILFLFFMPVICFAEDMQMSFVESNFFGKYRHLTYIKKNEYIFIDEHYKYDESGEEFIPTVPDIYSRDFSTAEIEQVINSLKGFGVDKWKHQYPDNIKGLICDGLSYSLYIKAPGLEINSTGACYFPENYKIVAEYIMKLHQLPNKANQQGPSVGTR